MSGNTIKSKRLVVMKALKSEAFMGSVKINFGANADFSRAVLLRVMPAIKITNSGSLDFTTGFMPSNPDFSSIVCQAFLDKSVALGLQCCVTGTNIGDVVIAELASSGDGGIAVLSSVLIKDAVIVQITIEFDAALNGQHGGDGVFVTLELKGTTINTSFTQFDDKGAAQGKVAAEIDRVKRTGITQA